jgi:hypothetical protein
MDDAVLYPEVMFSYAKPECPHPEADTAIDPDWLEPAFACCAEGHPCVHNTVHYLTEADSDTVLDGPPGARLAVPAITEYSGRKSWGGAVLLPRHLYELVRGQETRFHGWGPEDVAFALGLMGMGHCPLRLEANLIHLWHPTGPVKRPWGENHRALLTRYEAAAEDPDAMGALIAEKPPLHAFVSRQGAG